MHGKTPTKSHVHMKTLPLFALLIVSITGFSQGAAQLPTTVTSTVPSGSRFELVQTDVGLRTVFKVDKYQGDVYQFTSKDGIAGWSKITRLKHPADTVQDTQAVNYQLLMSRETRLLAYLVNVHTGASWILVRANAGGVVWDPVFQ